MNPKHLPNRDASARTNNFLAFTMVGAALLLILANALGFAMSDRLITASILLPIITWLISDYCGMSIFVMLKNLLVNLAAASIHIMLDAFRP